jgi:hypothetical protein
VGSHVVDSPCSSILYLRHCAQMRTVGGGGQVDGFKNTNRCSHTSDECAKVGLSADTCACDSTRMVLLIVFQYTRRLSHVSARSVGGAMYSLVAEVWTPTRTHAHDLIQLCHIHEPYQAHQLTVCAASLLIRARFRS